MCYQPKYERVFDEYFASQTKPAITATNTIITTDQTNTGLIITSAKYTFKH